jgi:hypothetical protein
VPGSLAPSIASPSSPAASEPAALTSPRRLARPSGTLRTGATLVPSRTYHLQISDWRPLQARARWSRRGNARAEATPWTPARRNASPTSLAARSTRAAGAMGRAGRARLCLTVSHRCGPTSGPIEYGPRQLSNGPERPTISHLGFQSQPQPQPQLHSHSHSHGSIATATATAAGHIHHNHRLSPHPRPLFSKTTWNEIGESTCIFLRVC